LSLFQELKRRNVFRVAIGYVVLAWLMAQVADLLLDTFGAPDWIMKSLLALFGIALPFVIYFAWAFELTPEGVKREHEVEREQSITGRTGHKLDRAIMVLLLFAVAWIIWDRYSSPGATPQSSQVAKTESTADEEDLRGEHRLPVVAVLPFKAAGSDDGGFLAGGLHDDLLTRLAKLNAFRVISRTSMLDYANTTKNMRQIGEELGASYILEGGVQAMPGRVRVNAQLISAAADQHLWAEIYDRELTAQNLFDVQAELAVAIANALDTELSPTDQALVNEVPTRNMEAYNAFLRGLQLGKRSGYVGTPSDRAAVAEFEEAVRLDPGFAEAWALLSTARIKAATNVGYDAESSEGALAALGRARALKPGMLESELAWAEYLYRFLNEYAQALETLEALGPRATGNSDALSLMAFLDRRLGRYREAYARIQQARDLAPRDPSVYVVLINYAWLNDDCQAAGRHAETLRLLAPDMLGAREKLAEYEIECNGNTAKAMEIYKGMEIADIGGWPYAFFVALHERDAEWAMRLIEWDTPYASPFDEVFDQLNAAQVSRYLLRDERSVTSALDHAESLLEELETNPEDEKSSNFAFATAFLYSFRSDASGASSWLQLANQRFDAESKHDLANIAMNRFGSAIVLAQAGMYDGAVEELRIMLEEPGGYRFPLVDGYPVFEALESHPGYIALRERFGNSLPR